MGDAKARRPSKARSLRGRLSGVYRRLERRFGVRRLIWLERDLSNVGDVSSALEGLELRALTEADIDEASAVRTEISRAEIEKRFGSGALSLAACRDGEIIAWQWAEFGAVSLVDFAGETFDFGPHGPHLFDAYTVPAARGMRVLPLVCNAMFHALAARGHERAVTLIRPENAPSRAAAAHLGFRETGALVQRSRGADRRITLRR